MSAVSPGRDGGGGQDWSGDVELDLLLLSAHADGLSALADVIDPEQGLAAILGRQQTEEHREPQRPGGDQLPGPAASRSPPPPAHPRQRDQKPAHDQIKEPTMNVTTRIRTTATAGIIGLAALLGGTAAAVVAVPAPHVNGGAAVADAPAPTYDGGQPILAAAPGPYEGIVPGPQQDIQLTAAPGPQQDAAPAPQFQG